MFKNLQLTFHLFVLYGLLGISLLLICSYPLFVIHGYEETISIVDRNQLPLARTVANISRYQLDQVLRFNELLLFARIDNQEKFEISHDGYLQAGKRMVDEILEGRNIAQRAIEEAKSESRSKEFDTIKTFLKNIEKAQGNHEKLGASLIRSVYQYDFLLKKEHLLSGEHIAVEEEAGKHVAFLKINFLAFEKETRRLEGAIREAMEQTKQFSQTLAIDVRHQKELAFDWVLLGVFFALSIGAFLVFFIAKIHKDQERAKNWLTGQSLAMLSEALNQLQTACQALEPSSQKLEENFFLQRDSFGNTVANVKAIVCLSEDNVHLSAQLQSLMTEKKGVLEQTDLLVKRLNLDAGDMLESGIETKRIVRNLKEVIVQINMLATNASAEAFRSEATRSFTVFTEEIKRLTSSTISVVETISKRTGDALEGIHADRLHVIQTNQKFSEVVVQSKKETDLFTEAASVIQKQSVLLQTIQSAITGVNAALQANIPLLEQVKTARNTLQSQVVVAHDALGRWPAPP